MSILTGIAVILFAFSTMIVMLSKDEQGEYSKVGAIFALVAIVSLVIIILCIGHYLAILLPWLCRFETFFRNLLKLFDIHRKIL